MNSMAKYCLVLTIRKWRWPCSEQSLLRTPNRSRSLLGAARAHRALGHAEVAAERYQALLANWSDDSLPEVREAKAFLGY